MPKISKTGKTTVILSESGEPMFRRVVDKYKNIYVDTPVTELGFTKTLDVSVILKRSYFSEMDYQKHVAYFVQKFRLKLPSDRYLQFAYFKYDKKSMGTVVIRNFDSGLTFNIDVMSKENQKEFGIRPIGKPVKVSAEKANVMLREKEVLGLFSDKGENIVIV